MNVNKLLLAVGVAGFIGIATPAQATWCWSNCGPSSSSGGTTSSSGGSTKVPEPEQMGLFAMGVAVLGYRLVRARRNSK